MRLIDADHILDFIDNAIKTAHGIGLRPAAALCLKKRIEDEPTIDPVRHGRWEYIEDEYIDVCKCSECGVIEYFNKGWEKFNFCPNCGARMEE